MKTNLPPGMPHVANFAYNIIGASAAVIPTEGLNAYLGYGLFKEISYMFEAEPDDHDLNQFVQAARLDINSLGAEISRELPPIKLDFAATDYYSHQNVIKTNRVNIDEKLTDLYNTAKRELIKFRAVEIKKRLRAELRAIFTNPVQGPVYASRLIASNTGPCLVARMETCQQHLREKIQSMKDEIDALELITESKFSEATKAIFLTKESKKNAYIEAKIKVYQARLTRDAYTTLIDVYKDLHVTLTDENDKIYSLYVEILQEINKIFTNNTKLLCQPMEIDAQKSYYWDIIHVVDAVPEIDEALQKIGAEPLIKDFTKTLLEESAKFLSENQLNISGAISDFIYTQFSDILARTMSDYLSIKYGSDRNIEHIIEAEVAPRLFRDAKPIFNLDNAAGLFNFPSYGMVSVPYNTPDIRRGIESYQQHTLSNLRFNIRKSNITDRIFWLNTQNGIPLFAFTPIKVYEELYERTISTREGVGRHLVMSDYETWVNLPSPIPEKLWGDTYYNPRQKALNDDARAVFKMGVSNGSIRELDGQFICIKSEDRDFSKYNFDIKTEPQTLYTALNELTKLRESGLPTLIRHVIFTTSVLDEAEAHFIRNVSLISLIREENAKYMKITRKTEEIRTLLSDNEGEKSLINNFLHALTCEAIVKRGAYFIYEKELEEDPWPHFVNLIEQADYPEFAMFESYKALTNSQQKTIKEKAKHNEHALAADKLFINLKKWQGKIAVRKNLLDKDMYSHPNGKKLYGFYRNVLLRLNSQVMAMQG